MEAREMPSTKDFVGAKLTDGFNAIGETFGRGARIVKLRKDIAVAESHLNRLALDIGKDVIKHIQEGETDIIVYGEPVEKVKETLALIAKLKGDLKNE